MTDKEFQKEVLQRLQLLKIEVKELRKEVHDDLDALKQAARILDKMVG